MLFVSFESRKAEPRGQWACLRVGFGMEDQRIFKESKSPMRRLWKFVGTFFVVIALGYAGLMGMGMYHAWKGENQARELAESLRRDREAWHQERFRDTFGGTTPQETLRLYIDAVEKGNYELASRYFILEKQDAWKRELDVIYQEDRMTQFLSPLLLAQESKGEYSRSGDTYSIHTPVMISFIKYSNGLWKLAGI